MESKIEDILKARMADPHPLKAGRRGFDIFARLVDRMAVCPEPEIGNYIKIIEDNIEKFSGCHCYVRLCLFLSIFCAPHLGMSAKAQLYFNKAKELQQSEASRGVDCNYFQEVYSAVARFGDNAEYHINKWPLCEMQNFK